MAVNKRAAMRREAKERAKLMSGKPTQEKLMARAYVAGKNEGLELATGIIFLALHEKFDFGQKRLEKLIKCISDESLKMDEDATKFNVDYYIKQVQEKCGISIFREENEHGKIKSRTSLGM